MKALLLITMLLFVGCDLRLNPYALRTRTVNLRLGQQPVSFDELSYDLKLNRVIVPGAESGALALVDPETATSQLIEGFNQQTVPGQTPSGVTSAVGVRGMIFAVDKSARKIQVIDPVAGTIVSSILVQGQPDYIRYVSATNELWVTERIIGKIEVFSLTRSQPPVVKRSMDIAVPDGPEGLLVDQSHGLAYTNEPRTGTTAVIHVQTHHILYHWSNGCTQARGLAIDEARGYLFVACNEGKLVLMDFNRDGALITSTNYGGALDSVVYNPELQHIYLPSAASAVVAIFAVVETKVGTRVPGQEEATPTNSFDDGQGSDATATPGPRIVLKRLGTADTAVNARCVTTDDHHNIWVCDPEKAGLFMIEDTFEPGG
jgi:DNA-binding beta-propeller fold protein YncE